MRLRTFTASSMPEALKQIKEALGDDAIILSSKEQAGGITVTAAIDEDAMEAKTSPLVKKPLATTVTQTRQDITSHQLRFDVQNCLRFHGIPEHFLAKMTATLTEAATAHILARSRLNIADESKHFLKLALEHIASQVFTFAKPISHAERIMLVGTPGIGKTLTAAKLATAYAMSNTTPVVITTDTTRAGGVEQLKAFTDILGIDILICETPRELQNELKNTNKNTPVVVDTAGCNAYDESAMNELAALANLTGIEPILVIASGMDSGEAMDIAEAFMQMPIHRMIATRTDSARRFGSMISIASAHKLALYLNSSSASVTEGLEPFSAAMLAQILIVPMLQQPANKSQKQKPPLFHSTQTV